MTAQSGAPAGPRRFIKPGTVVLCLRGRQAGKKALVLKTHETGIGSKKFACATVLGIQRTPKQVKKGMTKKQIQKRQKIRVFFKHVNYSHFMPTRFALQQATQLVNAGEVEELLKKSAKPKDRKDKKKELSKSFQEFMLKNAASSDKGAAAKWFMSKLHF